MPLERMAPNMREYETTYGTIMPAGAAKGVTVYEKALQQRRPALLKGQAMKETAMHAGSVKCQKFLSTHAFATDSFPVVFWVLSEGKVHGGDPASSVSARTNGRGWCGHLHWLCFFIARIHTQQGSHARAHLRRSS